MPTITGFDVNMTPMECMDYAESNMKTEISPLTIDGEGDSESDDGCDQPIYTVKPWKPVKATEAVILSLCDGAGCAILSLKKVGWEEIEISRSTASSQLRNQRLNARSVTLPTQPQTPSLEWSTG